MANEAERIKSLLVQAGTIGPFILNWPFETAKECQKKLKGDFQDRRVGPDQLTKLTGTGAPPDTKWFYCEYSNHKL